MQKALSLADAVDGDVAPTSGEARPAAGIDPLRVRGMRSQAFDSEGVATRKQSIIDDGVLTTWLLDSATARELGLATTGHAHRGVSSSPSPGPYNLHLEAGQLSPAELIDPA